ncbi:MAG: EAL domain-containing protein (putative c-di-GMP-specific phosphodiesterase class I) [Limisphaerales bacterium]
MVLQPQFDIEGKDIRGVECLLRWQGRERSCADSANWSGEATAPLILSINTSPAQFKNDAIEQQLLRLAQDNYFSPKILELELTHQDLLHVVDQHRATLYKLRDSGVRIAIDNLGVGVVDTEKQCAMLAKMGCSHAHGFLFAAPIQLADFPDYLQHRQPGDKPSSKIV